jgi:group I intron endonuclease
MCYVGFDSKWPQRKNRHEYLSDKNPKQYLHYAIQKYGKENFIWEVLFQSEDKEYTLSIMENKLILEHNAYWETGKGYNVTLGGEGNLGYKCSEETKKKMSDSSKGRVVTEETKQKISSKLKGRESPNKGKKFTEEHRKSLSQAKKGVIRDEVTKQKISAKLKGRVSPNKGNKGYKKKK